MSDEVKREPGPYWARFFDEPWEVARWSGDFWERHGLDGDYVDRYVTVGPRAINPAEDPAGAIAEVIVAITLKPVNPYIRADLEYFISKFKGPNATIPADDHTDRG